MLLHANAKLALADRLVLVRGIEQGCSLRAAAAAFSVSEPARVSRALDSRMLSWGEEILRCHVETEEGPRGAARARCAFGA